MAQLQTLQTTQKEVASSLLGSFIIALFCLLLHLLLAQHIAVLDGHFNFLLIACIVISFRHNSASLTWIGLLLGFMYDCLSSTSFGAMMLCFSLLFYLLSRGDRQAFKESFSYAFVRACLAVIVLEFVYAILLLTLGLDTSFLSSIYMRIVPNILMNCLIMLPVCFLMSGASFNSFARGHKRAKARGLRFRS